MFIITGEAIVVWGSALAAALSFAAFVFPLLKRSEQKDRYRDVIEKRRKTLVAQTRLEIQNKGQKQVSAKDSMITLFKFQKLAGDFGERLRIQLLQAGIRDPMAPIKFLVAQVVLPIIFGGLAFFFISASDKSLSATMTFSIIGGAILFGFFLPKILIKNTAVKRQEDLNIAFPDSLDMMLICVQGGIGLEQTITRVAQEISEHAEILAEELGILSAEMAMLNDRRKALQDFGKRVGGYGKSFATALIQAEQYGTSVSQALRVMSDELREIRMSKAEQKAMSLPPKLTVPMILFFLPALFIVILGPAGISAGGG